MAQSDVKAAMNRLLKYQSTLSHSQQDTSPAGLKRTQEAITYLQPLLPTGWERSFNIRRAGKHWGLSAKCPICGLAPPSELTYGLRRWRWLSVHLTTKHRHLQAVK